MTVTELNKLKVLQFFAAVVNEGRLELIDELVADDYIGQFACVEGRVTGPAALEWLVASRRSAHPDLYIKIEDQVAEDDRVVTRWRAVRRTASGVPTGHSPSFAGITIIRLLAGKQVDAHTQMQQCTGRRLPAPVSGSDAVHAASASERGPGD